MHPREWGCITLPVYASFFTVFVVQSLADPQKIRKELELAVRSLDQLQSYANLNRTASEWELSLRGPL